MPPKPRWLIRVPQIRGKIAEMNVPILDRAAIEKLFRLKRRQAIKLLHEFGPYEAGKTLVVPKAAVVEHLRKLEVGEVRVERSRRRVLREAVEASRRELDGRKVLWRVLPATSLLALPAGVRVAPGTLEVSCTNAKDLLEKLFALSRAIAADYPGFEVLIANPGP